MLTPKQKAFADWEEIKLSEVKWIKITTNMFDNRKIKHIRKLPEGNNMVLIWIMLLTMAGRCNAGGFIFLTENIPYTPKMLADELGFEESIVCMALKVFEELEMIFIDESHLSIPGWEEYQNIEGLEKIREYEAKRKSVQRERKKTEALSIFRESQTNLENFITIIGSFPEYQIILDNVELYECIKEWAQYKDDKKPKSINHYNSERGIKKLLNKFVEGFQKFGTKSIIDVVNETMANNYQGISWDKLYRKPIQRQSVYDEWRNA